MLGVTGVFVLALEVVQVASLVELAVVAVLEELVDVLLVVCPVDGLA